MKKTHKAYLRKIIGRAIDEGGNGELTASILRIKSPDTDVYQMMRDIVCDARFYSVIDRDSFWKTYGEYMIGGFVDSISDEEWNTEETLTMRKEEFLNKWMSDHMMPFSDDRRRLMEADIRIKGLADDKPGMPDPDDHDGSSLGEINLGNGIKDATKSTGQQADGLPPMLKDYMKDAAGGNSPGLKNECHRADAHFLDSIDPSIVRLAKMIGRRGENAKPVKGRFRPAPKSDISGVTTGDDLNSLLPTELAMLATPSTERIFIDRFVRKRLQTFSSVSTSASDRFPQGGPVYICIDTSGSMTGQPEVMAKTLALAICIIAQKERRPVCIFNYSSGLTFFVLKDIKTQRAGLLRFLSRSYGGGNDEEKLFRFLFERMPKSSAYRKYAGDFKGADMLVISDFIWCPMDDETETMIEEARRKGMRIFSVACLEEDAQGYGAGFTFHHKSDFRFEYDGERIKELFS